MKGKRTDISQSTGQDPTPEQTGKRDDGVEPTAEAAVHRPPPEPPPEPETETEDTGAAPGPEAQAAPGPEEPPDETEPPLEQLREEARAQHDRFLRVSAEFENYKKRVQKEHAERLRYAMTPLVKELAAIVDNLERAVSHARNGQENGGQALLEGIEMVVRQIHEVFAKFGVTRIECLGKPFDPQWHEAMTVVETGEVPENQVMEEFQSGYLLHERVVRPARVSVSKRPAAPPGDEAGE